MARSFCRKGTISAMGLIGIPTLTRVLVETMLKELGILIG